MRFLLVEDDPMKVDLLTNFLAGEGYELDCASRQDEAISMMQASNYNLVLLGMSPRQGGCLAVCVAAAQVKPILPVIVLNTSTDEYRSIAGLSLGVIDYLDKPFHCQELLVRIRTILREGKGQRDIQRFGNIEIDASSTTVRKHGNDLFLSALEYRLLLLFCHHPRLLITREHLRDALRERTGEYVSDNALSVYVKRLRERIEDDPSNPKLIVTIRGLGYRADI